MKINSISRRRSNRGLRAVGEVTISADDYCITQSGDERCVTTELQFWRRPWFASMQAGRDMIYFALPRNVQKFRFAIPIVLTVNIFFPLPTEKQRHCEFLIAFVDSRVIEKVRNAGMTRPSRTCAVRALVTGTV
jgi:hypothetical protein